MRSQEMTDLEMTKLCAEAMVLPFFLYGPAVGLRDGDRHPHDCHLYDPLHDDAQAMVLDTLLIDERHSISFHLAWFCRHEYPSGVHTFEYHADMTKAENRRRARVECVAKMQAGK